MNVTTKALMLLAAVASIASAQEPKSCASSLHMKDLASLIGPTIRVQPVFERAGVKGWRLYGTNSTAQLMSQGIGEGTLITHVCGVPANEIAANDNIVCCNADAAKGFEVSFQLPDGGRKVLIQRP
jgi:hypothetical protein